MSNRLSGASSPYLLQHADNPVDWYPWGEEALTKARQENKPVFLSIGYAACHWCHVMAHESFEDPGTAALMNEHFVNIKVDREERPDLDGIYMDAVVAMTGHGGWPMSVFLFPSGEPFFGGTYFPPTRKFNMPAFREVLLTMHKLWTESREELSTNAQKISQYLKQGNNPFAGETADLSNARLDKAAFSLAQSYDWKKGGWGKAPKFPQPMAIEFLLRRAVAGDSLASEISLHALHAMARGGMYDVVGGGFARYSVDDDWLVPHFEKMLYDNAQLARCYLHAYQHTGDQHLRRICEQTLDFVIRELTHPDGGFFSSLDADSEGEEGKFYIWTIDELKALLRAPDFDLLETAYAISKAGNFEGHNVLQRRQTDAELANQFNLSIQETRQRLDQIHAQLLAARETRIRPGLDDKVLTSWNGLMAIAFIEAGTALSRPDYLKAGLSNVDFITKDLMSPDGQILRSWRNGQAIQPAFLEDYAALILALLAAYQATGTLTYFEQADQCAKSMIANFQDSDGAGFFDTSANAEALILRPKSIQDNAIPSGQSLAIQALLWLYALDGNPEYEHQAANTFQLVSSAIDRYPTALANWLCAAHTLIHPPIELAIIADRPASIQPFLDLLQPVYNPRLVIALHAQPVSPPNRPVLLAQRTMINGQPTAFVCQNFTCQLPTNEPQVMLQQISAATAGE